MGIEIVVVGAGYAGLAALRKLSRQIGRHNARLTLISEHDFFVERVRLHQFATGQPILERPLEAVIQGLSATRLVTARATLIDLASAQVRLATGDSVRFDHVVVATGSHPAWPDLPGLRDHACSVATREEAEKLRERFRRLPAGSRIVVVGGGFTGVETATELATQRRDLNVQLVTSAEVGSWLAPRAQRTLRARLEQHRVEIHEHLRVVAAGPSALTTSHGELRCDLLVWAAGFAPSGLAAASALAVDERGRMLVDESLASITDSRIIGAGDIIALPDGGPRRMACQTAIPMGWHAAATVRRQLSHRTSSRYRPRFVWSHVSLGRDDGLTQLSHLDDRPLPIWFAGRPAAWLKERVLVAIAP